MEKMTEGIAKGTAWERITEMISLENSRESAVALSVVVSSRLGVLRLYSFRFVPVLLRRYRVVLLSTYGSRPTCAQLLLI